MAYEVNLNSGPKEGGSIKRGSIKVARLNGGSIKRGLLYFVGFKQARKLAKVEALESE